MDMKFLPALGGPPALELIEGCMASLKRDYQINLDLKSFEQWPGRLLTFEEYLTMILVEKDLTLKWLRRK
jgi:hypothetical protein